jgi:hypothetical protein
MHLIATSTASYYFKFVKHMKFVKMSVISLLRKVHIPIFNRT